MRHDVVGHYLRRTSRRGFPRSILVFDTETEYTDKGGIEYHTAKLAWSVIVELDSRAEIKSESWHAWRKRYHLLEYIENMAIFKGELLICGNNIYFDLQASSFFQYFTHHEWSLSFVYEKGTTYILIVTKGKATIKIVSLTNYLEASVESLGAMINLPKIKVDFAKVDDDTLSIYCFRDTEITLDAFIKYIQFIYKNDLGKFSLSKASQAMQAYRHKFMAIKIYHHYDLEIMPLEELSYFGGRTEMFRIGKIINGPFIDLDINSMYPFIMKTMSMPTKCFDYHNSLTITDLKDIIKSHGVIADVTIQTDQPIYPVRIAPKVIFPIGRFRTQLCSDAVAIALQRGHIRRVHRAALYEMAYPFADYVDFFYDLRNRARKEGNDIIQRMAKLFMNSLYGKFAQRRPIVESDIEISFDGYSREEIYDPETDEYETVTRMLNREIITRGSEVMQKSIIAIPSHITDYGRCMLWKIIEDIGSQNVLYCDTDSIKIREKDLALVRHSINDSRLGAMKIESRYKKLILYGLKDYETDNATKMKGVPKRAIKNADGTFSYKQFLRQSSHLRANEQNRYMIKDVIKRLKRVYTKGKVNSDGSISPWVFPDDESVAARFR